MDTDGVYTRLLHRPVSRRFLDSLARHMTANSVTTAGLVTGVSAAAFSASGHLLIAALLSQLFCVISCLDGEVARARKEASKIGDFYDTLVDRIVELSIAIGLVWYLSDRVHSDQALWVGIGWISGIFLITYSSEKYRSAFGRGFPKPAEGLFVYVSSGVDARLTIVSLILLIAGFTDRPDALVMMIMGLSFVVFFNVVMRLGFIVSGRV